MILKHRTLAILTVLITAPSFILIAQNTSILLEEHFDNNTKNWLTGEDQWAIRKVKGGKYYFECKGYLLPNSGTAWACTPGFTLPAGDIIIECKTKWIKNRNNNGYFHGYGFFVGEYSFQIYGNGDRTLHEWDGSKDVTLVDFAGGNSGLFTRGAGVVDLRIEIIGGQAYFYGNDQLLFTKYINYKGGRLCFVTRHSEVVEFDDLIVRRPSQKAIQPSAQPAGSSLAISGLTDTITINGVTISVNPSWKKDEYFLKSAKLSSLYNHKNTLPDGTFDAMEIYISSKPGTIDDEIAGNMSTLRFSLDNYYSKLPANGKGVQIPTDRNQAVKQKLDKVIPQSFTTSEGKKGKMLIYEYQTNLGKYVDSKFVVAGFLSNDEGNWVAKIQIEFSSSTEAGYYDYGKESMFSDDIRRTSWEQFVTEILKSAKVKFTGTTTNIAGLVKLCTDTISKYNAVVNVNPEWKKLNTGYSSAGNIYIQEAWKAKSTFPFQQRISTFNVGFSEMGTLSSAIASMKIQHKYGIKDFYSKLGQSKSTEEIEKETAATLAIEDIVSKEGKKGKLFIREYKSANVGYSLIYYFIEVTAAFEKSPEKSVACSFIFSEYNTLDEFSKNKALFSTPDEKNACVNFCKELLKTVKIN